MTKDELENRDFEEEEKAINAGGEFLYGIAPDLEAVLPAGELDQMLFFTGFISASLGLMAARCGLPAAKAFVDTAGPEISEQMGQVMQYPESGGVQ